LRKAQKQLLFFFVIFLIAYIAVHELIHIYINMAYNVGWSLKFFGFGNTPLTDSLVEVDPNQQDLARLSPEQYNSWLTLQMANEVIGYSFMFLFLIAFLIYVRPKRKR